MKVVTIAIQQYKKNKYDTFFHPYVEGGDQARRPHDEQHQHHPVEFLLKIVEASALYLM